MQITRDELEARLEYAIRARATKFYEAFLEDEVPDPPYFSLLDITNDAKEQGFPGQQAPFRHREARPVAEALLFGNNGKPAMLRPLRAYDQGRQVYALDGLNGEECHLIYSPNHPVEATIFKNGVETRRRLQARVFFFEDIEDIDKVIPGSKPVPPDRSVFK